jgi:hypothetical protein
MEAAAARAKAAKAGVSSSGGGQVDNIIGLPVKQHRTPDVDARTGFEELAAPDEALE